MKCDRCLGEMEVGLALPSMREDALGVPWASRHPVELETVLKCRDCGRSLSVEELKDREFVLRIAKTAEAARHDPGEDVSGLSDQDFIDRLFGKS